MIKFIKQLFCRHKYEMIDGGVEYNYQKYEDEFVCIKCGKLK